MERGPFPGCGAPDPQPSSPSAVSQAGAASVHRRLWLWASQRNSSFCQKWLSFLKGATFLAPGPPPCLRRRVWTDKPAMVGGEHRYGSPRRRADIYLNKERSPGSEGYQEANGKEAREGAAPTRSHEAGGGAEQELKGRRTISSAVKDPFVAHLCVCEASTQPGGKC